MSSKTTSIAIPIQNGQRTHSQDQEATGWTDNSFKMTKTIPMTVRQPRPLDAVDFVDIDFSFSVVKHYIKLYQSFHLLLISVGEKNAITIKAANAIGLQGNRHKANIDAIVTQIQVDAFIFVSPNAIISKTLHVVNRSQGSILASRVKRT